MAGERPDYSPETTDGAWSTLATFLLPAVVGATHMGGAAGVEATMAWVRGHPMARAAVEMAAWDLQAKLADVPLWKAIGGSRRPVPTGIALGLQPDRARLNEQVAAALAEGYRRIKLKVEPGKDVERVRAVRERFPDAPLSVDANGAFGESDPASLRAQLRALDELGLLMIEQPLPADDLLGHARLQAELATPICLDESIGSLATARQALELGSGRVINVKPGRVGGIGEAKRIHDLCAARGLPVWCGGMLESGVGRAHNVALATLPGFTLPGDLSPSRRYWARDLVHPEWEMTDGQVTPPTGPGIGVEVDRERIEASATRRLALG